MSYLYNDPTEFTTQMIAGLTAAYPKIVRAVDGGVVRSTETPYREVAVVIGGGTGHYPAFAGLVGEGLAHGAALGNVFASPSTSQVVSVSLSAQNQGGVLLSFGNYAGDVLNFEAARDELRAQGIAVEIVAVTDDISSASTDERHRRRGVAGDLFVFKVASAMAETGAELDAVARAARRANERTRSFGVSFSSCTLPGASAPLFSLSPGRLALGLGIHGEPGLGEIDALPSAAVARLMVDQLLADLPDDISSPSGRRVAVLVNGLGSLKYEEMFVLFSDTSQMLKAAGVVLADVEIGEYCTSFDMAGVSISLLWLDDELEALWSQPAASAAYRRGSVARADRTERTANGPHESSVEVIPLGTEVSQRAARVAVLALHRVAAAMDENTAELGLMDAVAGDGDHGLGMQRGSAAAADAARIASEHGAGIGTTVSAAGRAWAEKAGGTSGALWGRALVAFSQVVGDDSRPTAADVSRAVRAGAQSIVEMGKATVGDKTMVDALLPFAETLDSHVAKGVALSASWDRAASVAEQAALSTADLIPKLGRARPHAHKSVGTPDPGAFSFALAMAVIAETLNEQDSLSE